MLADRVHEEAAALLMAPDLETLLDDLGRAEFVDRQRQRYEELVYEVVRELGQNWLTPAAWRDAGVDLAGPASLAMLTDPAVVVSARLTDRERFTAALYHHAFKRRRPRFAQVGRYTLIGRDSFAAVVGHGDVLLVFAEGDALALAEQLATLSRDIPLRARPAFRRVLRRLPEGDLNGFVDLRSVVYMLQGLVGAPGATRSEAARDVEARRSRALAHARSRGAKPADLVALDAFYAQRMSNVVEEPEAAELRGLLGGLDGIGLSAVVERNALSITAHVEVGDGSPLRQVWLDSADAGLLASIGRDDDAVSMRFSIDPARLSGAAKEMDQHFGTPLRALRGDGALVVRLPTNLLAERAGVSAADVEFVIAVGVRDPKTLASILDDVIGKGEAGVRTMSTDFGDFHVAFSDSQDVLLISNKRGLLRPQQRPSDRRDATALELELDLPTIVYALGVLDIDPPAPPLYRELPVQGSAIYLQKLAELREVENELARRIEAAQHDRRGYWARVAAALGDANVTVRRAAGGVEIQLRLEAERSLAQALSHGVDAAMGEEPQPSRGGLAELFGRRLDLELELRELLEGP